MIRGLYAAASGMITGVLRQGAVARDVANANTPGYKGASLPPAQATQLELRRLSTAQPGLDAPAVGPAGTGVYSASVETDFGQGPLHSTRRSLDVALEGEGFFQVQTPDGPRFTRDGRFHRDANGNLTTGQGYLVLDANSQSIQLPQEGEVAIAQDGTLSVDGQAVGQLGVFQVVLESLQRAGEGLFVSTGAAPEPAAGAQVRQGFVEGSNVDPAATLVEMMSVARMYEASQRLVQVQDQMLARTMDVGRLG
ncbi:MAG: Flagellar basal-body rod protein FlgG [Anaerolineales bacterium]|nr:Flagellar basal-body rod protein FlgG [Anaerolineales bacterium]